MGNDQRARARLRSDDKAAISRRVSRLEDLGALTTRPGLRGTKLVNIAEFDRVAGETIDAVRAANGRLTADHIRSTEQASKRLALRDGDDPILAKEQAKKTAAQARLAQIDLADRLGQLFPLEQAQEAARNVAARLRRAIEQTPSRAEEVASSLAKDSPFARALPDALRADPQGARSFFRALARTQLAELARMATAFDVLSEDTNGASVAGLAHELPIHA